jgi:hypothetical protein
MFPSLEKIRLSELVVSFMPITSGFLVDPTMYSVALKAVSKKAHVQRRVLAHHYQDVKRCCRKSYQRRLPYSPLAERYPEMMSAAHYQKNASMLLKLSSPQY